ncbi:APC family permease [Mycoplasma sp. M5725]|uniref:APC family permease n=1 Tax=Mycoplasma phocimorsus TaxID=3045839 RepID=A0AAJ1UZN3_9MOLU|nr:APC family permease [Mycoplasma phocimorsus]MDJ1645898.1 APC family permease [Mycoplasma phocimorsus]MDJ1648945.1 APC family permease [Mycoplasma phocimorsus]
MKKRLNERQFTLLAINYIIGFGFVSTILSVVQIGYWSFVVMFLAALVSLGTMLSASKLVKSYPNEIGGTVAYAEKTGNKELTFFAAMHQYIQVPLFSASGPLFLVSIAEIYTNNSLILWMTRGVSLLIFFVLVLISIRGFNLSKFVILEMSLIKWAVLILGFILVAYYSFSEFKFHDNIMKYHKSVSAANILNLTLLFTLAFGGIETLPNMTREVKFKNIRKVLLVVFAVIFTIYVLIYFLFLGTNLNEIKGFVNIYDRFIGPIGVVIFGLYLISYNISSYLTSTNLYSNLVASISHRGFFPETLGKKDNNGEYKNAIIFNTLVILVSMTFFTLLPAFIPQLKNFFNNVIALGITATLVQYLTNFVVCFILEKQRKIPKIHIIEKIFYIVISIVILIIIIATLFPVVFNEPWTVANTVQVVSYFSLILISYTIWISISIVRKKRNQNKNNKKVS